MNLSPSEKLKIFRDLKTKGYKGSRSSFLRNVQKNGGPVGPAEPVGPVAEEKPFEEGTQYVPIDASRESYIDEEGFERSEYKIGVNVGGKEWVIPTVWDGEQHTEDEAYERFLKTGLHMGGPYDTIEEGERSAKIRTNMYNQHPAYVKHELGGTRDNYEKGGLIKTKAPQHIVGKGYQDRKHHTGFMPGDLNQYTANVPNFANGGEVPTDPPKDEVFTRRPEFNDYYALVQEKIKQYQEEISSSLYGYNDKKFDNLGLFGNQSQNIFQPNPLVDQKTQNEFELTKLKATQLGIPDLSFQPKDLGNLTEKDKREAYKRQNQGRSKEELQTELHKLLQNDSELTELYKLSYKNAINGVKEEASTLEKNEQKSLNKQKTLAKKGHEESLNLINRGGDPNIGTDNVIIQGLATHTGFNLPFNEDRYNLKNKNPEFRSGIEFSQGTQYQQSDGKNYNAPAWIMDAWNSGQGLGSELYWNHLEENLPSNIYKAEKTYVEDKVHAYYNKELDKSLDEKLKWNLENDYGKPTGGEILWDMITHPADHLGIGTEDWARNMNSGQIAEARKRGYDPTFNPLWNFLPMSGMAKGTQGLVKAASLPAELDMWSHIVPSAVNVAGHWLTPESIHDQLGIYEPGAMDYANLAFTMMGANRLIKGGKNLNQLRKDYLTGKPVQLNPLHRTAQKGIAKDKLDYWAKNNPNATSEELTKQFGEFLYEPSSLGQLFPGAGKYRFGTQGPGGGSIFVSGANPGSMGMGRYFNPNTQQWTTLGEGSLLGNKYKLGEVTNKPIVKTEGPSKGSIGYDQYVDDLTGATPTPKGGVNYEKAATTAVGAGVGAYAGYDYLMNDNPESLAAFFALPWFKTGPKVFQKLKKAVKKGDKRSMLQIMQDAQLTDKEIQAVSKQAEASNIFKRPEAKIVVKGGENFVETINPFNGETVLVPQADYIPVEGGAGIQKITDKAKEQKLHLDEPIIEEVPEYTTVPNPYGEGTVEVLTSEVETQLGPKGKGEGIKAITNRAKQEEILQQEALIEPGKTEGPIEVTDPYTGDVIEMDPTDVEEFTGSGGIFGSSKYGEKDVKKVEEPKKDYSAEEADANKPPPKGPKFGEGMFNPYSLIGGGVGLYEYLNDDPEAATEAMLMGLMGGRFKGKKFKGKQKGGRGVTPRSQASDKNAFNSIIKGDRQAAFVSGEELIKKYGSLENAQAQGLTFTPFSTETYTARGVAEKSGGVDPYGIVHANTPEGQNVGSAFLQDIEKRGGFWNTTTPEADIATARLANYDEKNIQNFINKQHPDFDYKTYNANNPRDQFISDAEQGLGLEKYYTPTPTVETFDSGGDAFNHFVFNPVHESVANLTGGGFGKINNKNAQQVIDNLKIEDKTLTDNAVNWAVKNKGKHYTDWNTKLGKVDGLNKQELKALKLIEPDGTLSEESLKKILGKDVYEENKIGGIESNILQEAKDKAIQMYINEEMRNLGYDTKYNTTDQGLGINRTQMNVRDSDRGFKSGWSGRSDPNQIITLNSNLLQFDRNVDKFLETEQGYMDGYNDAPEGSNLESQLGINSKFGGKNKATNDAELRALLGGNIGQNLIYSQIIKNGIQNPIGKYQNFNVPDHKLGELGKYGITFSNEGKGLHGSTVELINQKGPMKTDSHPQATANTPSDNGYNIRIKNEPFQPTARGADFKKHLDADNMEIFNTRTQQWENLGTSELIEGSLVEGLQTSQPIIPGGKITMKDVLLNQGRKKVRLIDTEIKELNTNIKNIKNNAIEETNNIRDLISETEATIYGDIDPAYIETVKNNPAYVAWLTDRGMLTRFDEGTYAKKQGTYDPDKFFTGAQEEKLAAAKNNVKALSEFVNDKDLLRQFLGIGDTGGKGYVHSIRGVQDIEYIQEHGKTRNGRELPHLKGLPLEEVAAEALSGVGYGALGEVNYSSNSPGIQQAFGGAEGDWHGQLELMFPEVEAMLADPNATGLDILSFLQKQIPRSDSKVMQYHRDAIVENMKGNLPKNEADALIKELDEYIAGWNPKETVDWKTGFTIATDPRSVKGSYRMLDEKFRKYLGTSMTAMESHYGGYGAGPFSASAERGTLLLGTDRIKINKLLRVEEGEKATQDMQGPRNKFETSNDLFKYTTQTLLNHALRASMVSLEEFQAYSKEWNQLKLKQSQINEMALSKQQQPTQISAELEDIMHKQNAQVDAWKRKIKNRIGGVLGTAGVVGIGVGVATSDTRETERMQDLKMKNEEIKILMKEMKINRVEAEKIYKERVLSE